MKALIYKSPGAPDVLEYIDVPDPEPGPRDVIVDVAATALNHLDIIQRNGWFTMPGFTLPHISGMDVVGAVIETGRDVTRVAHGDRVVVDPSLSEVPEGSKLAGRGDLYGELGIIGATANGGYAERCLAPETHVHKIPDAMSWHHAAVFPTAWLTAHHALFDVGGLKAGETVMIHAAGSGVSMAGIQLAKDVGATVLATAGSDRKCDWALDLGADHVTVNRSTDITAWARELTDGAGVNMVFDHVGQALWSASMLSLTPRGRIVSCGNTSGDTATIPSLGFMFHMGQRILGSDPYRYEEFVAVWEKYCAGDYRSLIDSVYPLAEGGEAQEKMYQGNLIGKIVLEP